MTGTRYRQSPNAGDDILVYTKHTDWVLSLAWSPDGQRIASAGRDKVIRIWDATTPEANYITEYDEPEGWIKNIAWSPDGKYLATANMDKNVRLYDLSCRKKTLYTSHTQAVNVVAWSHDSKLLASGGDDGLIYIWDIDNPVKEENTSKVPLKMPLPADPDEARQRLFKPQGVQALAWSPATDTSGPWIASAGAASEIHIQHAYTGNWRCTYKGHTSTVTAIAWCKHGEESLIASADKNVHIWKSEPADGGTPIAEIALPEDLKTQKLNHRRASRFLEHVKDWQPLSRLFTHVSHSMGVDEMQNVIPALAWSPDARLAVARENLVYVYKDFLKDEESIPVCYDRHKAWVKTIAWNPSFLQHCIASAGEDTTVRVWYASLPHQNPSSHI